jgi:hypothetical protein
MLFFPADLQKHKRIHTKLTAPNDEGIVPVFLIPNHALVDSDSRAQEIVNLDVTQDTAAAAVGDKAIANVDHQLVQQKSGNCQSSVSQNLQICYAYFLVHVSNMEHGAHIWHINIIILHEFKFGNNG